MNSPPVPIQQLIERAKEEGGKEQEQAMDLRIEFRCFGKPSHLWDQVLVLMRHLEVMGPSATFFTLDNTELYDNGMKWGVYK